jgi:anthranilate phosphoribosyltransferase
VENAMVVYGMDGMDEISLSALTRVSELKNGNVTTYDLNPEDYGMKMVNKSDIIGGDSKDNAKIIMDIFNGVKGPKRDIVVLNAAAALYVGKAAQSIKDGIKMAEEIIDSGKALNKLNELKELSNYFIPVLY